jgi:hypothetical protein
LLSPRGARTLLSRIAQLKSERLAPPRTGLNIQISGIDGSMNAIYAEMNAYCCVPPIAFVQNDHRVSKIQAG